MKQNSSKDNGLNFKQKINIRHLKIFILLALSNIIFYLIFSKPTVKSTSPTIDLSKAFVIRAKLKVPLSYKGEINILDARSNKMYEGFRLVKVQESESFSRPQVVVLSTSGESIKNFWKKNFIILPTRTKVSFNNRRSYDQSF